MCASFETLALKLTIKQGKKYLVKQNCLMSDDTQVETQNNNQFFMNSLIVVETIQQIQCSAVFQFEQCSE